jgi:hypothetical protein
MASESVQMLVILTPKPGKADEVSCPIVPGLHTLTAFQLIALCEEGAEHHKALSACTKWLCSREINSKDGEDSFILVQE